MAAAAQKFGMFLCVQDLTCPGASLDPLGRHRGARARQRRHRGQRAPVRPERQRGVGGALPRAVHHSRRRDADRPAHGPRARGGAAAGGEWKPGQRRRCPASARTERPTETDTDSTTVDCSGSRMFTRRELMRTVGQAALVAAPPGNGDGSPVAARVLSFLQASARAQLERPRARGQGRGIRGRGPHRPAWWPRPARARGRRSAARDRGAHRARRARCR